jgi:transcriptional regulator with XRE-family HTH domain
VAAGASSGRGAGTGADPRTAGQVARTAGTAGVTRAAGADVSPASRASAARLGRRLRVSRRRLGLTQEALSVRTGLSKSFLSQVESGRANPTLDSLYRLAEAVETPLSVLLGGPGVGAGAAGAGGPGRRRTAVPLRTTYRPARAAAERRDWEPGEGRTYPLTPPGARRFETVLAEGTPAHHAFATCHPGEELCHVLAGRLRADVDGEGFDLGVGDTLHYDSGLAHSLVAVAAGTRFLLQVAGLRPA